METALLLPALLMLGSVGFIAVVAIVGIGRAGRVGEDSSITRRWMVGAAMGLVLWLALSGILAASGMLSDFSRVPPPMMLLAAGGGLLTIILAFSPVSARFISGLPIGWLVGYQAFRIVVEIALDLLYHAGAVPVQMSVEGRNFDMISGVSALAIAALAVRGRLPEWGLQLWNLLGFGLLLNIVIISILSFPLPIRMFLNEPANVIVTTWPFVWLPVFLVPAALFGHLLVFRRLWQSLRNAVQSPARTNAS